MKVFLILKLLAYIFLFFFQKIKNFRYKFFYFIQITKDFFFFNLFKFKFNRSINPSKNYYFRKFTKLNNKIWHNNKINKKLTNNILLTSFVHTPEDTISNTLISKYLERNYKNAVITGLLDKPNIQAEITMRSFGVKNFIYLQKPNIIEHLKLFIKSFLLLNEINSIESFLKFKYRDVFHGKIISEHIIRHSGFPQIKKINFKINFHFAEALHVDKCFSRMLENNHYKSIVMSENQFLPSGIIFQRAINKKLDVFSRHGWPKHISVIKFSKPSEIYTARAQVSKKIYKKLIKNNLNFASKVGKKIFFEKINKGKDDVWKRESIYVYGINQKKVLKKKDICNLFNWDPSKKIIGIYAHTFLDGNYVQGWRTFNDNYEWLLETLKFASKTQKYNFLAKPHPMDHFYKKSKITTKQVIKEFDKKFSNIKLFPEELSPKSGFNVVDIGITSHGTASIEFLAIGKPCITAGRTSWGDIVLNQKPITKKQYFNNIKNADKLKMPSQLMKKKIYTYLFIQQKLMVIENPLLIDKWFDRESDKNNYWKENIKLFKKYKFEKDVFNKSFEYQVKKKIRHTVNLKFKNKLNFL
jgi:hypothetical protein